MMRLNEHPISAIFFVGRIFSSQKYVRISYCKKDTEFMKNIHGRTLPAFQAALPR
jgi:hypothetical protein